MPNAGLPCNDVGLSTLGTIGFLHLSEVGTEVRVLRIDGRYPGEAGHLLQ